ncbi:MAG: DUF1330 domain-containing protein [Acidimicrobiia bacterium]|nr:DUF1330 domain-containing protein [Acidimicrobiia bacterium]
MPAFLIADAVPHDMDAYRASGYLEAAVRTAADHGGRYRVRGGEMTTLEGDFDLERLVIIEFPSMAALLDWYRSEEYQEWIPVRQRLTRSRLMAVDGVAEEVLE